VDRVEYENKTVVLTTSNLFVKEWILTRYQKALSGAVKTIFGTNFSFILNDMVLPRTEQSKESALPHQRLTEKKPLEICALNNQYTFDDFVPGGGNVLAFQSAKTVASQPGRYNPLFIFGEVGLGKTHLLQAIGHGIRSQYPEKKVMYMSSEQFMNELVQSIKHDRIESFRQKYRNTIDVLLIDDIQFLIGKMGIQNELFHTFNMLFDADKQIAFCSDRIPKDLGTFHERLISRFQMGLVVELMAPDIETRKKIIERISKREKIDIPPSVVSYLAYAIRDNIRKVYGTIVKLFMMQQLQGRRIDVQTLKEILEEEKPTLSSKDSQIIRLTERELYFSIIEKTFSISKETLVSNSRSKEVSEIRKIAIYAAHKQLKIPVVELSKWFQKTHSTIHYAIKKTEDYYQRQHPATIKSIEAINVELSRMRTSAQA
jgi:chromosomal replication initiator protein